MRVYKPGPLAHRGGWVGFGAWEVNDTGTLMEFHVRWPVRNPTRSVHPVPKRGIAKLVADREWVPLWPQAVSVPEGM